MLLQRQWLHFSTILDKQGIAVRAGQHCAGPLMHHMGINASCRASFAFYNTKDEVDKLLNEFDKSEYIPEVLYLLYLTIKESEPKIAEVYKENNINATYDKIKLEDHEIKNFIQDIKKQKIAGCNVTVPFKKTVIPFLDKLSPEAEKTQSVNTITFNNGNLVGHNTDIVGFDTAIKKLNFNVEDIFLQ